MTAFETGNGVPVRDTGWFALFRDGNALYSIAFGSSVALHALNIFITATILPSAVGEIGGLDFYSWATTVFVISSIVSSALTSHVLALTGPRGAYVIASVLFIAGTVCCALADTMIVVILGRAIQGFGGGLFYALAYAVIRLVYRESLWPIAIGLTTVMWGVATLIGPAIGGVFAEFGVWRAAFWSLVPLTVLFCLLAVSVMPGKAPTTSTVEDVPYAQLALMILIIVIMSAASLGGNLPLSLAALGGVAVCAALFLNVESKARARIFPAFAGGSASELRRIYLAVGLMLIGMQPEIFAPYFLQVLHGQSPLSAGYLGALMALGWTAGSMLSAGWAGARAGRTIRTGPIFGLAGLIILSFWLPTPSSGGVFVLSVLGLGLALVGFGIGYAWPHIVTRVYKLAPSEELDLAATAITTVQLFATAFGAALAGVIVNLAGISGPDGASRAALWLHVLFLLAPAACVLLLRLPRRKFA